MKRNLFVMATLCLFAIGAQAQIMPVEMKQAGMMWYYSDYRDARLAPGIKVVGNRDYIPEAVEKYKIDEIIVAIPTAPKKTVSEILEI